jgi:hypothetical protein
LWPAIPVRVTVLVSSDTILIFQILQGSRNKHGYQWFEVVRGRLRTEKAWEW